MDKQPGLYKEISQVKDHAFQAVQNIFISKTATLIGNFLFAFLLSGSQIMPSMMPFALAYAAAKRGSTAAATYGGAFFGYVLIFGSDGLCYASAVLICYTAMILFGSMRKVYPAIMPACAAISLLVIKGAIVLFSGPAALALLLCESALCGLFCTIFVRIESKTEKSLALGQILLLIAILLAIEPLRIFGIISPARAVCCLLCMSFSYYGGSAMGAGTGVAMGAAMDLATWGGPLFSFTYSFSALLSGTLAGGGKLAFTCLYIVASAASVLWNFADARSMSALYECFMASVIFYMLPAKAFTRIINLVPQKGAPTHRAAVENILPTKLKDLSEAISGLSGTVSSFVSSHTQKNDDNISRIYDHAADKVCRKCTLAPDCWTKNYPQTCDALTGATATLQTRRHLEPGDFPAYFAAKCVNMRSLCGVINNEYGSLMRRNSASQKSSAARKIMQEQYESISGVLTNIAISLDTEPEYYPTLEARVKALAASYLKSPTASVYLHKGRMHVEISSPELTPDMPNIYPMIKSLSLALERSFAMPEIVMAERGYTLRATERERYSALVNTAVRKCNDAVECGDSTAHFSTDDGRAVIMLSDGMGTGSEAASLSRKALELITQFVKSGCNIADSARAVLPVLAAQFEECGFVTLDLLEINLFTGRCQLLKYGAAPSFALKSGVAQQFTGSALPAGLEQLLPASPQPILLKLSAGDKLIMVSDGICDNLDGLGFGDILTGCQEHGCELTAKIINYAGEKKSSDDMTAIVVELRDYSESLAE